ncbi:MAG: DUF5615 family PIN-like protein [Cyanobacteria bacterium P01_F01_bin.143]
MDENINPDVAKPLRLRGIEVTTTQEINLLGETDEVQFDFVCQQQRVIVTHDTDFLRLAIQNKTHTKSDNEKQLIIRRNVNR